MKLSENFCHTLYMAEAQRRHIAQGQGQRNAPVRIRPGYGHEQENDMASIRKYRHADVTFMVRHNAREHPRPPSNVEIDSSRTQQNYYLTPVSHGHDAPSCLMYYHQRLDELFHLNRHDVKTACQWVITAPRDLDPKEFREFFQSTYDFLNTQYGEKNCIQCVIHFDEGVKDSAGRIIAGKPHLHYLFIPAVRNPKYGQMNKTGNLTKIGKYKEKVCANQLISPRNLKKFHPMFQRWIDQNGPHCTVHSGVTDGKNRTVKELKRETKQMLAAQDRINFLEAENMQLKEKIENLQQRLDRTQNQEWRSTTDDATWDNNPDWGTATDRRKEKTWDTDL